MDSNRIKNEGILIKKDGLPQQQDALSKKEEFLYLARVAEQCDRFDEMTVYISDFCRVNKEELTKDERNILCVAFKNAVGTRRAAWRTISKIERKELK